MAKPPVLAPANVTFQQRTLTILLGAILIAIIGGLSTFFYWLASTTMEIGERTTRIEGKAESIEEKVSSLIVTRTDQSREQAQRNTRRIESLEEGGRGSERDERPPSKQIESGDTVSIEKE